MRNVIDSKQSFQQWFLPQGLSAEVLKLTHDNVEHNCTYQRYVLLRTLYYWKG